MPETGWIEEPKQDPVPQGTAAVNFMLSVRGDPREGRSLQRAFLAAEEATGRDAPEPEQQDADDRFAGMVSRGYRPGELNRLSQELADVSFKLAAERKKIDVSSRLSEHLHRAHEGGRMSAFEVMRAMGAQDPEDEGDEALVGVLERRESALREEIAAMHETVTPPSPRQLDGVEAASRTAHDAFVSATRAAMTAAEAGQRVSRPKAAGGTAVAVRSDHVCCADCQQMGVRDADEERQVHELIVGYMAKDGALTAQIQDSRPFEMVAR